MTERKLTEEAYNKIVNIEARTMVDMAVHQILPAAMRYTDDLCQALYHKQSLKIPCKAETELVSILSKNTDALYEDITALNEAREFARLLGFGKIVECTAEEHDRKIALTSQLAHIVSNAYVKSNQVSGCDGFTGGSFQDMTRIAGVDERMWSELYMLNRPYILEELDGLIKHLTVYKDAIADGNEDDLRRALAEGKEIRRKIKRKND